MSRSEPGDERADDARRLREAFASLAERARPREDCPEPDRLWAALRGELPARERRALVDHTSACAACAEAWRLARELVPEVPLQPGWLSRIAAIRWSWSYATMVAAASAVLLAVAITALMRPPPSPNLRDPGLTAIRSLLPDGESVPRRNVVLKWSPGPEGSQYEVVVTAEDLRPIASARDLESPEVRIPEERLTGLAAGAKLLWQVELVLPSGARVRSETFVVRIQ